jgi:hypothetical protein
MSQHNCAIGRGIVTASFKGFQFYCTEASLEGGRRGAEGEFPFGEKSAYADLGKRIRVIHISAVFRENNHIADIGQLFRVCESKGPGVLVHPTQGTFNAACRSIKIKDPLENGIGESFAEMEFVEANPASNTLGDSLYGIINTSLNETSKDSFIRDYKPTQVAQPWRGDIVNTAQHLVGSVATSAIRSLSTASAEQDWRDALKIQEVAQDDGLATDSEKVNRALKTGFDMIATAIQDPQARFTEMRRLANIAISTSIPQEGTVSFAITPLPEGVARRSEEAVLSRHRILAGIHMAEATMARKYTTMDQALAAKDQVLVLFEDEAKAAYTIHDNELFLEIKKYSIQFEQMMNDLAYRLPGLVAVNFSGGVHPLKAAYVIYNDAKRHRELELRNIIDANGRFGPIVIGEMLRA